MKVQVILPATIIMSVLMGVLVKVRREEKQQALKRATFLDIKLRVSDDVMRQYENEKVELKQDVDTAMDLYKEVDKDMKLIQEAADKARLEAEKCAEEQVRGPGGKNPCLCFPRPLMRVSPPLAEIYER